MTDQQSLLDQIAEARRERDAAAVESCEGFFNGVARGSKKENELFLKYRAARLRLIALETQLKESGK